MKYLMAAFMLFLAFGSGFIVGTMHQYEPLPEPPSMPACTKWGFIVSPTPDKPGKPIKCELHEHLQMYRRDI